MDPDEAKKKLRDLFDRVLGTPAAPPPMAELVRRLDAWLARHRPDFYAHLLPGLTDQEWASFVARLGVEVPDSFRELYQWRNGQHDDVPTFHGNRTWMSSEEVVGTKELKDS